MAALRVGILFEYGTLNGGEFSMLAALGQFDSAAVQVQALCPVPSPLSEQLGRLKIPCVPLDSASQRSSPAEAGAWSKQIAEHVQEHGLQLLHANSLAMGRRLGAVSRQLPCPTTAHLRDIIKLSKTAMATLNQHRALIAVSQATAEFHLGQGLHPERLHVVYNGIDIPRWQPRQKTGMLHRQLGLDDDAQLAVTIGQICLRKGQNDLASAAALLRDRCPRLHFLLVGLRHSTKPESIAFDERITQTFAEAGMTHRCHRLGFRDDVAEILNEADLLIHPARQEPFGRVLLEAGAMGLPVIATQVGGTAEMLQHGESAWLVPSKSPESIAQATELLLTDDALRRQLGTAARKTVASRFSIEMAADGLLKAWKNAIS